MLAVLKSKKLLLFGVAVLLLLLPRVTSGCSLVGFLEVIALEMLLFVAETPKKFSLCQCLILMSPLYFFRNSLEWNASFSSVVGPALVPNFAISLFLRRSSGTPGSWITVVVGEVPSTIFPGANVSQSPIPIHFCPSSLQLGVSASK